MFLEGLRHDAFADGLYPVIDGEFNVHAVLGGAIGSNRALKVDTDKVGFVKQFPVRPREIFIVIFFDPCGTRIVG